MRWRTLASIDLLEGVGEPQLLRLQTVRSGSRYARQLVLSMQFHDVKPGLVGTHGCIDEALHWKSGLLEMPLALSDQEREHAAEQEETHCRRREDH